MEKLIHTAITHRLVLKFRYRGIPRTAHPYACGVNDEGVHLVVAWQLQGRWGDPPGWRIYNVDRLVGVRSTGARFPWEAVNLNWARLYLPSFHLQIQPEVPGDAPPPPPPRAASRSTRLRTPWSLHSRPADCEVE
ncbi:hypothetical protein GCM10023144_31310 [Pigmentiphaga soli]|uniref:WYL domain-containing protein n=1 Tax=Pigmentiphaga soli TaxID=1007095 RepID=A0ABP8HAF3_9BURK